MYCFTVWSNAFWGLKHWLGLKMSPEFAVGQISSIVTVSLKIEGVFFWHMVVDSCSFQSIGVPPKHPFIDGFSLVNHLFWGTPIYGHPPSFIQYNFLWSWMWYNRICCTAICMGIDDTPEEVRCSTRNCPARTVGQPVEQRCSKCCGQKFWIAAAWKESNLPRHHIQILIFNIQRISYNIDLYFYIHIYFFIIIFARIYHTRSYDDHAGILQSRISQCCCGLCIWIFAVLICAQSHSLCSSKV